jgi:hypothetical protein
MPRKKYKTSWLNWVISKSERTFKVYVVEPGGFDQTLHKDIFDAAMNNLLNAGSHQIVGYEDDGFGAQVDGFDLITFPEAFLSTEELFNALTDYSRYTDVGCVHVGLRPKSNPNHLFSVSDIGNLIEKIKAVDGLLNEDLVGFENWHRGQTIGMFNLGCFFGIDVEGKLRVCLHPKVVKSKFEVSGLPEGSMKEADFLALVTLVPENKALLTITIQPLLCSDALPLSTDRPDSHPLTAITRDGDCFEGGIPDHVDVVSLALCSPQERSENQLVWQNQFRETFRCSASSDSFLKHHYAVFVLANFSRMPEGRLGGLSGVFTPNEAIAKDRPDFVDITWWGKVSGRSPDWGFDAFGGETKIFGYIASLKQRFMAEEGAACMFGFKIDRLPRDAKSWTPGFNGIQDFRLNISMRDPKTGELHFRKWGAK